jgi:hypothetical protein
MYSKNVPNYFEIVLKIIKNNYVGIGFENLHNRALQKYKLCNINNIA